MANIVGIIGAMEEEVQVLKDEMKIEKVIEKASLSYYKGVYRNKPVVVVQAGIGKVNAAICTQALIDMFDVAYVINTGVAGALSEKLEIGDVVVSSDAVYHDFDTTVFGYDKGVIPRMDISYFKADENLIKYALEAEKELQGHLKVYAERIVSGDQFISSDELKKEIATSFNGYCTEMEGAAIAHTCYLNKIPFIIIRSISDKADNSADISYEDFTHIAVKNSITLLDKIIERI